MIAHKPEIRTVGDEVILAARVEIRDRRRQVPDRLWFAFPRRFADHASERADAFAVGLIPTAMRLGEELRVTGPLSPRLARGLREYQRIQATWKPSFFREVELRIDDLSAARGEPENSSVGSAFSGGVDSFYTLWSHLPDNEPYPSSRISHCVMISGAAPDLDTDGGESFRKLMRIYEPVIAARGPELIGLRTNLFLFMDYAIHKESFAAFLTACSFALGSLFSSFYVPSSYKFTDLKLAHDGSHLILDGTLATEATEVVHDGAHLSRAEKTAALTRWPETRRCLRTCCRGMSAFKGDGDLINCCRCEKCVRTMSTLDVLGVLEEYRCFPLPLRGRDLRRVKYLGEGTRVFAREIVALAQQTGRGDIARNLRWSLLKSAAWWAPLYALSRRATRLQATSARFAKLLGPLEARIRRSGLGAGWLYWPNSDRGEQAP